MPNETDPTRALVDIANDAAQRGFNGCVIDLDVPENIGHVSLDDLLANKYRKGGTVQLPAGTVAAADALMARGRVTLPCGHVAQFTSEPRWAGAHWINVDVWPPAPAALDTVATDDRL